MGLSVHIEYEAEITEWIQKYPSFLFLRHTDIPDDDMHRWITTDSHWGYIDETTYQTSVMFIGKTGYGKSTTLNTLIGKKIFDTSDISACTKDLYNAMYRISNSYPPTFFCINDLPGIGESIHADSHYYDWYREMIDTVDVVVYLLRADQRDFAIDENLFKYMFEKQENRSKVILALNFADKVEPINRKNELTNAQIENLKKKVNEVSRIFKVPKSEILYYSAATKYNIHLLTETIAKKLKNNLR